MVDGSFVAATQQLLMLFQVTFMPGFVRVTYIALSAPEGARVRLDFERMGTAAAPGAQRGKAATELREARSLLPPYDSASPSFVAVLRRVDKLVALQTLRVEAHLQRLSQLANNFNYCSAEPEQSQPPGNLSLKGDWFERLFPGPFLRARGGSAAPWDALGLDRSGYA